MTNPLKYAILALLPMFVAACSPQQDAAPPAPAQTTTSPQATQPAAAPPARELIPSAPGQAALPPGHPPTAGVPANAGPGAPASSENQGTVTAVHQAGGYTYIEVERGGQRHWLASNPVKVAVGEQVQWGQAALMRNFTSKALGRTFDELLFVTQVTPLRPGVTQAAAANRAKVLSLTQAGGYSFLELEAGAGRQWMAAQAAPVAVGDTVSWNGGMLMRNFTSQSLGRTFDEIIFVGAVERVN